MQSYTINTCASCSDLQSYWDNKQEFSLILKREMLQDPALDLGEELLEIALCMRRELCIILEHKICHPVSQWIKA